VPDRPESGHASAGRRFGAVGGAAADPLPAPAMPTVRLKARDRHGTTID